MISPPYPGLKGEDCPAVKPTHWIQSLRQKEPETSLGVRGNPRAQPHRQIQYAGAEERDQSFAKEPVLRVGIGGSGQFEVILPILDNSLAIDLAQMCVHDSIMEMLGYHRSAAEFSLRLR